MQQIKDYKKVKVGQIILFKNSKEECQFKVIEIVEAFFGGLNYIVGKCGKFTPEIIGSDFKNGFVYKPKTKQIYYKELKKSKT